MGKAIAIDSVGDKIEPSVKDTTTVIGLEFIFSFGADTDNWCTSDLIGVSLPSEALKYPAATGVGATGSESGLARWCPGV